MIFKTDEMAVYTHWPRTPAHHVSLHYSQLVLHQLKLLLELLDQIHLQVSEDTVFAVPITYFTSDFLVYLGNQYFLKLKHFVRQWDNYIG